MAWPDFSHEHEARAKSRWPVCGIDEAGRGPWAGPVVAAAVILDPDCIPEGLNDSKKLSQKQRDELFAPIMASAKVGIGIVAAAMIDDINILQATYLAMQRAMLALELSPALALIDGNRPPKLSCAVETIIGGDGKSLSIAAASIIAKVTRDRIMHDLDIVFPLYGFAAHKGYGTERHNAALEIHGPCAEHRKTFAPVLRVMTR